MSLCERMKPRREGENLPPFVVLEYHEKAGARKECKEVETWET